MPAIERIEMCPDPIPNSGRRLFDRGQTALEFGG